MSDSRNVYLFGAYSVCIEDPFHCKFMDTYKWNSFRTDTNHSSALSIVLHKATLTSDNTNNEQWQCVDTETDTTITFRNYRRNVFRLVFPKTEKRIHVFVEFEFERNFQLGIQYALMLGLAHECVGLHGVTVICENQRIILSAPSGTGKTTLAQMLKEYCNAEIVNGDFALLAQGESGEVLFQPTPFCGTSEQCSNVCIPIDRIVFLEQAPQNIWSHIKARQAISHLLSNIFIPNWNVQIGQHILNSSMSFIEQVKVSKFAFYPDKNAAKMFVANIGS